MDIMELGAIGELVGGVAVLVTLVYLAVQVRHGAKATRYATTQNLVATMANGNFLIATHDGLASLLQKALSAGNREVLEPHERLRFNAFFFGFYNEYDFAYHQHLAGQLEADVWDRMA